MPYIDESALDDQQALAALDSRGTLRALATAGAQVRHAVDLAAEARFERLTGGDRPRSVLVAALGGSAVIADVLELLAEPHSPVPVQIRRNLPLPGWVGSMDLVVAVSQSGHAEGPVALAAEAARRGAALLTIGAADSPLAEVAARARGIHISVPVGSMSSRTALWAMLTPVLLGAHALGMVDAGPAVMAGVADRLDEQANAFRPSSEAFVNPAKSLACELAEAIPGRARGRTADRCRRLPGGRHARPHRSHPRDLGRAAGRGIPGGVLLRRPLHRRGGVRRYATGERHLRRPLPRRGSVAEAAAAAAA